MPVTQNPPPVHPSSGAVSAVPPGHGAYAASSQGYDSYEAAKTEYQAIWNEKKQPMTEEQVRQVLQWGAVWRCSLTTCTPVPTSCV